MNGAIQTAVPPTGKRFGLWRVVFKLLRLRLVIFSCQFRKARLRAKIGTVLLVLLALIGFSAVFAVSWFLLGFLRSSIMAEFGAEVGFDTRPLLESIPVLIMGASFIGILLTSFGVLLQALYLAGDMDFLLTSPIPIRAVFVSKLLQAILPNFTLIVLFGLPILFGLGAAQGYNFLYYPLVLVMMAALSLAAAGLSALLVMGVVRFFPARRVAEVIAFFGAITSMVCSQSGNLFNAFRPDDYENFDPNQVNQGFSALTRFNTPWSPLAWAGRSLVDIGEGNWLPGVFFFLFTLALAGGAFYISLTAAERLYYTGWASVQVGTRRRKPARTAAPERVRTLPLAAWIEKSTPAQVRAIIIKDFVMLRRDLRNMAQALTAVIFGIVYMVIFVMRGDEISDVPSTAPEGISIAVQSAIGFTAPVMGIFVGWMLISRLASVGFSSEGRSYWLLKSAPVGPERLLAAKFLVAYLPSLLVGWLFLVVVTLFQKGSIIDLLFGAAVIALTLAGAGGITLAFGSQKPNLEWTDPRQMTRGSTSCLAGIITLAYMPLSLGLFFLPAIGALLLGYSQTAGLWVGFILGGGFSLAAAIIPLWLARRLVTRIGE